MFRALFLPGVSSQICVVASWFFFHEASFHIQSTLTVGMACPSVLLFFAESTFEDDLVDHVVVVWGLGPPVSSSLVVCIARIAPCCAAEVVDYVPVYSLITRN